MNFQLKSKEQVTDKKLVRVKDSDERGKKTTHLKHTLNTTINRNEWRLNWKWKAEKQREKNVFGEKAITHKYIHSFLPITRDGSWTYKIQHEETATDYDNSFQWKTVLKRVRDALWDALACEASIWQATYLYWYVQAHNTLCF